MTANSIGAKTFFRARFFVPEMLFASGVPEPDKKRWAIKFIQNIFDNLFKSLFKIYSKILHKII